MRKMLNKEFIDEGYLAYINNVILHPLGLAINYDTKHHNLGVLKTDDPDGIIYDVENIEEKRKKSLQNKINNVRNKYKEKFDKRYEKLGYFVEPI